MIAVGFVMMVLNCTPVSCDYVPADDHITDLIECRFDVVMNLLEDPSAALGCGEVKRDEDNHDGTNRYFRSGAAQIEDTGFWESIAPGP